MSCPTRIALYPPMTPRIAPFCVPICVPSRRAIADVGSGSGRGGQAHGHSVETLVSTYVGALDGDETVANERIGAVLGTATISLQALTRGT
jgi:hypothetical protein